MSLQDPATVMKWDDWEGKSTRRLVPTEVFDDNRDNLHCLVKLTLGNTLVFAGHKFEPSAADRSVVVHTKPDGTVESGDLFEAARLAWRLVMRKDWRTI